MTPRAVREALILLLLTLLPAFAIFYFHPKSSRWNNEVEVETVKNWKEQVLWIDARSKKDFINEHVPGALLLNETEWNELLPEVIQAWNGKSRVVVYCSSITCESSRSVAKRLRAAGLSSVYILKGGWESWKNHSK